MSSTGKVDMLDCSNHESIVLSASELLKVAPDHLLKLVSMLHFGDNKFEFANKVFDSVEYTFSQHDTLWHHATRVIEPQNFAKSGIQTKAAVRETLLELLTNLSEGLLKSGVYPNQASVSGKSAIIDEGPFATLFKQLAVNPPLGYGCFHRAPEIVEDISGHLLGENYLQLVAKFQSVTTPCIVTFRSSSNEESLMNALWYLKLRTENVPEEDAYQVARLFFDGKGQLIPPENIVNIEILNITQHIKGDL